ncbi:hypothetical protein PISMIDRAFT_25520 [Pisolithus microcarpus 441]|uniref:Uncharacterized protein n=1 Tax=Pisolithus microcarpus 441 TaxID=765257 RepID=A0A0C9Z0U3_9AGAM|nr:hypothetical protein PISMIDRAFT_25520 [Pisolithus microcarpus 441]
MYMETPEEGLIQMLKMVIKAKQTWMMCSSYGRLLKGLRSKMKRRGALKKMIEEVQDMYETLESATPIMDAIMEGMLDVIDVAFVESFKDKRAIQCLCMPDELHWAAAWNAYAISQYVDQIKETSTFKDLNADVQTALLSCSDKVTFLIKFAFGEDLLFHYRHIPFMT